MSLKTKKRDSDVRLVLYIVIAALVALQDRLISGEFSLQSAEDVVKATIGTVLAAAVAWRAYIDKTVAMVEDDES